MSVWPVMNAPGVVQIYRLGFAAFGCYLGVFVFRTRQIGALDGLLILDCLFFCSLLGLVYSFIRAPRSRWVVAISGVVIPIAVFAGMCLMVWSRPTAWWDWVLSALLGGAVWFGAPIGFAVALFKDRKAEEYFTGLKA